MAGGLWLSDGRWLSGGLWLWSVLRPSGLVAVVVPSGLRVMVQPHWWTAMRWWKGQSKIKLARAVGPPWDRGLRWWTWQPAGRWRQPGKAQCRSRVMTARRRCAGTVAVAAPVSKGRLTAGELGGEQPGAQERGQPGRAGQHISGVTQQGGLEPAEGLGGSGCAAAWFRTGPGPAGPGPGWQAHRAGPGAPELAGPGARVRQPQAQPGRRQAAGRRRSCQRARRGRGAR